MTIDVWLWHMNTDLILIYTAGFDLELDLNIDIDCGFDSAFVESLSEDRLPKFWQWILRKQRESKAMQWLAKTVDHSTVSHLSVIQRGASRTHNKKVHLIYMKQICYFRIQWSIVCSYSPPRVGTYNCVFIFGNTYVQLNDFFYVIWGFAKN